MSTVSTVMPRCISTCLWSRTVLTRPVTALGRMFRLSRGQMRKLPRMFSCTTCHRSSSSSLDIVTSGGRFSMMTAWMRMRLTLMNLLCLTLPMILLLPWRQLCQPHPSSHRRLLALFIASTSRGLNLMQAAEEVTIWTSISWLLLILGKCRLFVASPPSHCWSAMHTVAIFVW